MEALPARYWSLPVGDIRVRLNGAFASAYLRDPYLPIYKYLLITRNTFKGFERKGLILFATGQRGKGVAGIRSERHNRNDAQHISPTSTSRIVEFPSNCCPFHCACIIPIMLRVVPFSRLLCRHS